MGALQLVLGLICLAATVVAVVMVVRTVRRMVSSIRIGQPDPTRTGPVAARLRNVVVEVLGHTRMLKWGHVGVAHWLVMAGFIGLSLTVLEAYFEVFHPPSHLPLIGTWPVWNLVVELLGIGTVLGGFWLIGVRQVNHPRRADRVSRFLGSNFGQAYFVEAVVVLEGIGIMGLRAFKQASGLFEAPVWAAPVTHALGGILPASTAAVSVFAAFKILSAMIWLMVIARIITMGVAWHRFTAFFNIYFKREDDGGVALGAVKPMMSAGKPLDFEEADPDTDVFGAGKIEDFSW
ncbi:Fe-S oxidoreductase, partial [Saccharopolyspora hirsuta]